MILEKLQVTGAEKRDGVPEDHDDLGPKVECLDPHRVLRRIEISRSGLAAYLTFGGRREQLEVTRLAPPDAGVPADALDPPFRAELAGLLRCGREQLRMLPRASASAVVPHFGWPMMRNVEWLVTGSRILCRQMPRVRHKNAGCRGELPASDFR